MNDKREHHSTRVRQTEIMGVGWQLILSWDVNEWVVRAETEDGEAPPPLRTADEQEAIDVFENFERLILASYEKAAPSEEDVEERAFPPRTTLDELETIVATAIIGVDTLWGGDVNNPSGLGRFIADCYCSGKDLPGAYQDELAVRLRGLGGVSREPETVRAALTYIERHRLEERIESLREIGAGLDDPQGRYLESVANSLGVMFDLAQEVMDRGERVPYERAVHASTGEAPSFADTAEARDRVAELLERLGRKVDADPEGLGRAVDTWRRDTAIDAEQIPELSARIVERYDELTRLNVMPLLRDELLAVPRANIEFLPIEDAWFSGSMNYLGRARKKDGSPRYEATYEINAALEISAGEFEQLVTHEVVPGHVTTFAFLQHLYHIGLAGFEATIQTMNTRASTLSEGIANNAILFALGVSSVDEIEDDALQLGVRLALLQDVAKNNASYLLYAERLEAAEVEKRLRRECLISSERADKLAGAWGGHPLLGRMYLPSYRVGTEVVQGLLQRHGAAKALPAVYGCHGVVDVVTVQEILDGPTAS